MMNTKLIALCLVFHVAHSLGGPVNAVSENTTARYDFENSPKERLASQGPMDASVQDVCFLCPWQCGSATCCYPYTVCTWNWYNDGLCWCHVWVSVASLKLDPSPVSGS
ncbi:hypothetical protein PSV09DRAFT_2257065 [Bipolaris maydis]|uniref:uncharacterized protein n=1 Tax=Cochliobolus heterostrophus TaxID=5016 RepID=UPI0024D83429|nr:hypothetical protein J3E74DRAFT_289567 [Bipolaris maydis]KAJ6209944.1 hypothetical protein PSV09DRAFT_2257065 [Bipolaris maydis]KAJ6272503.1 hypothetical protein PSV08DRAFT_246604 [Bipolaris maydis]